MKIRLYFTEADALVLDENNDVLFPQSCFLNEPFSFNKKTGTFQPSGKATPNPKTQKKQFQALQALEYFLTLNQFTIEENITKHGVYFELHQAIALRDFMALPLHYIAGLKTMPTNIREVDFDNRKRKVRMAALNGKKLKSPERVSRKEQGGRLTHLNSYLATHYHVFRRFLYGPDLKGVLKKELVSALEILTVKSPKGTGNQAQIVSFPRFRWEQVLNAIKNQPEQVFLTASGNPAQNLCRHQAVALMCADGLRLGAVAFAALKDIDDSGMYTLDPDNLDLWIEEEDGVRNANTAGLKNHAIDGLHFQLNEDTNQFVQEYMTHRASRLKRLLGNPSRGLLFINDLKGTPLRMSHVTHTFECLKRGLDKLGLLDVDASDVYTKSSKKYECRAHVFRHTGVCDFAFAWLQRATLNDDLIRRLCEDGEEEAFKQIAEQTAAKYLGGLVEALRVKFGWSTRSPMPNLYAQRVLKEVTDKFKHSRMEDIEDAAKAAGVSV